MGLGGTDVSIYLKEPEGQKLHCPTYSVTSKKAQIIVPDFYKQALKQTLV